MSFFSVPGSHLGYHMTFSCNMSLVSFWLEEFLKFSLFLMTLIVWGIIFQVFCKMSLNWYFLILFSWLDRGYGFSGEGHRDKVPFSKHTQVLSTWHIPVDVDLDHLDEVMLGLSTINSLSTPPFLYWTLWKAVTTHSPHLRSGELCSTSSRMVSLHKLSGILLSTVLHNQILQTFWLHPAAPSLPPLQALMLQTCMCLQVLDSTILSLISVLAMATLWAETSRGFLPCMFNYLFTFKIAQIPCTLRSLSGTQSVLGDFPLSPQIPSACLHHGIHPSL